MNRDLQLLAILGAVVVVAAALWFFLSGEEAEADFVAADSGRVAEEGAEPATARRVEGERPAQRPGASHVPSAPSGSSVAVAEPDGGGGVASIFGRVSDPDGQPVPGATASLCVDVSDTVASSLQGELRATITSDANGDFEIGGIPVLDRYVLRVDDATFATAFVPTITLARGQRRRIDVRLSAGLPLAGRVVDLDGAALKDVEILVFDQQNRTSDPALAVERSVFTDGDGRFAFANLNPGFKRVVARKPGYACKSNPALQLPLAADARPLEFRLGPGARILGTALDADTRRPIGGLTVSAAPVARVRSGLASGMFPPVKTDADGRFIYEGLVAGAYNLRFFGEGYSDIGGPPHPARTTDDEQTFLLGRMPSARGCVVDDETGAPVESFTLHMGHEEQLVLTSAQLRQRFHDPDGRFEYVNIGDKHTFHLFATAPGYAGGRSALLDPTGGDVNDVEIRLYRGSEAAGRVVDSSGEGVAGARVAFIPVIGGANGLPSFLGNVFQRNMRTDERTARTAADGTYTVTGIPEGVFKIVASHPSFAATAGEEKREMPRSGRVKIDDLVLLEGGVLTGIVRDAEGDPVAASHVSLAARGSFGGGEYSGRTGEDGRYRIEHVRPGIYTVRVSGKSGAPDIGQIMMEALGGTKREVVIGDGDVQTLDLQ